MNIQQIAVALMVIACIAVVNYQEHKPIQLTKDILIPPSQVLKRIFYREGVVVPKEDKSGVGIKVEGLSEGSVKMVSRGVPRGSTGEFKTYLPYKAITSKESPQYKLQQKCITDYRGLRVYNGYATVAMGQYYAKEIGQKFLITFDTGKTIKVMIGDFKQDIHCNETRQYVNLPNKNVVEFIVSVDKINDLSRKMGDMSYTKGLDGKITKIEEIMEE